MAREGSEPIQVFVVAPAMLSWGLERLVQTDHPHLELTGTAATLAEAMDHPQLAVADVVVLDLDGGWGPDAVAELHGLTPARLVVLSSSRATDMLDRAVVAGAHGIVRKNDPPASLLKAIEKVHGGELWIDRSAAGRVFLEMTRQNSERANDPDRLKIATLTARERLTIMAVTSDAAAPGKVIASRMCISEHTLRNHLSSIYDKLGLQNRVALYAYATKHRLHLTE